MKKVLLFLLIFVLTSFSKTEKYVYICGVEGSSKYHYTETCKGLSSCKHKIEKVTLEEAKNLKLGLCGWED
jgi:hypothetical protein